MVVVVLCVYSISQHLSSPEQQAELNKDDLFVLWKTSKLQGGTEAVAQFRVCIILHYIFNMIINV